MPPETLKASDQLIILCFFSRPETLAIKHTTTRVSEMFTDNEIIVFFFKLKHLHLRLNLDGHK